MSNQQFLSGRQLQPPSFGGTAMFPTTRDSQQFFYQQPINKKSNVIQSSDNHQFSNKQGNSSLNYDIFSKLESMEQQLADLVKLYHNLYYLGVMNNNNLYQQNQSNYSNNKNTRKRAENNVVTSSSSSPPLTQTLPQNRRSNMQHSSVVDGMNTHRVSERVGGWREQPASRNNRSRQNMTFDKPPVTTRNRFDVLREETCNEEFPQILTSQVIELASNIRIIRGNLFSAPDDCALVHCVGADFLCGRGIAVKFKKLFGNLQKMLDQLRRPGQVAVDTRDTDKWKYIFHLVTKKLSTHKPDMENIVSSLCELRQCCHILNIKKIAMPKIACGKDLKNWDHILNEINSIFGNTGIDVTIYTATRSDIKSFSRAEQATRQAKFPSAPLHERTLNPVPQGSPSSLRSERHLADSGKEPLGSSSASEEETSRQAAAVISPGVEVRETGKSRQAATVLFSHSAPSSPVSPTIQRSSHDGVAEQSGTPASGVQCLSPNVPPYDYNYNPSAPPLSQFPQENGSASPQPSTSEEESETQSCCLEEFSRYAEDGRSANDLFLQIVEYMRASIGEVSNMFIMSLAAADLTVGGIVMPISSVYAITGRWVLGLAVCQFWLSADYTASTASIFNLFILSVDRYWSITSPLRYLRKRTKKRALIMIGLVWLVSTLWIVPIISWHHIESSGRRLYPPTVCETEFAGNVVFKVTAAIFNFYFPTVLMVYLYGRIFFEIKKRSRFEIGQCNHSRLGSGDNNEDSLADDRASNWTVSQALQREQSTRKSRRNTERAPVISMREWRGNRSNTNGEVRQLHQFRNLTVLSYREEGALLERRGAARNDALTHFEGVTVNVEYVLGAGNETSGNSRGRRAPGQRRSPALTAAVRRRAATDSIVLQKEKKAARQLGVIMGAFVLCWLPYFVLFMVIAFCGDCVDPKFHTATIWLGYVNSTLNPILYPLCNANFKRAFKRMLGFGKRGGVNNPVGPSRKAAGGGAGNN